MLRKARGGVKKKSVISTPPSSLSASAVGTGVRCGTPAVLSSTVGLLVGAPVGNALAVGSSPPALLDLLLILGALVDLELILGAFVDLLLTLGAFVDFELIVLGALVDFEVMLGALVLFGALVLLLLLSSEDALLAPFRVALKVLSIRCRRLGGFCMSALISSESSGLFCLSMCL